MTIECQHGQLARVCELCALETRVMELEAENQRYREALKAILKQSPGSAHRIALQALGDKHE